MLIEKWFNALMFVLSEMIFWLIKVLYQVFEAVANANLFTEEIFDELTGRIYLIMGIAMLFIFAYNLVLMIINPDDKKGTGAMSKVVKETIISLIAVVLLPTIFSYMYTFQSHVISSNLIGQLILGGAGAGVEDKSLCNDGDYDCLCDFSFLGNNAAAGELTTECDKYRGYKTSKRGANLVPITIFSAFFRPANFTINECANHLAQGDNSVIEASGDNHDLCVSYFTGYQMSKYTGQIHYLSEQDALKDGIYEDPKLMEFDSILAVIAGGLGAWMFLCYAMEIGVRVIKLGVLQLISPIPVMMRVVPGQKEKMYSKWYKELLNTYLDVFIRLIIIYFALYAVSLVDDMITALWSSVTDSDSGGFVQVLAVVIIILGILKFAQEAPELIKTFFGSSGKFALRSPGKQVADNKYAMGAMGAVGGAVSTAVKNRGRGLGSVIAGAGSGLFRGARAGASSKNFKSLRYNTSAAIDRAIKARDERDERKAYDGEFGKGYIASRRKDLADSWERFTSSKSFASLNSKKKNVGDVSSAFNKAFDMAEAKLDENATLFFVKDASGEYYSYDQYMRRSERAQEEYKTFDRQRYEEKYGKDAADRRLDELLKAQTEAANTLKKVKESLVDGMLRNNGKEFAETIADGLEIKSSKKIDGLAENIQEARNLLEQHSSLLSEQTKIKISDNDTVRGIRGALKGELASIGRDIAALSELQKGDK